MAGYVAGVTRSALAFMIVGSSEEWELLVRDRIHLTKQGKNILANRLANLMRRVLNWVISKDGDDSL